MPDNLLSEKAAKPHDATKAKQLIHETGQMACIKIETNRQEHLHVHTQKQGVTSGSWSPTTSHCEKASYFQHPPAPRRRTKSLQLHIRQWRKVCLWRSRLPALAPLLKSTFPSKQKRPLLYPCHSNLQEVSAMPHHKTSNVTNRASLSPNSLSQNTQMQTKT